MKIVCVLRSGGEYDAEHVEALRAQLAPREVICLCDEFAKPAEPVVALEHFWPGWWAKLEMMDVTRIPGDILYFDLDTLIWGDTGDIIAACQGDDPIILEDFYRRGGLQSAMMYLPEAARREAWAAFVGDAGNIMARFSHRSDQEFLETLWLNRAKRWQDLLPDQIVSYKADCRDGVPESARVIIFHGQPRPWDTPLWDKRK